MVNSGRGRSGGSFLRSTWFLRVVELVLVPALLVYSLWLPPASLGSRLFSDGYPVISAREGGTVLGPNGSSLNVPAGAVASRTKVRLDALSCNAEAGVTVARPELFVNTAGIQALQIKPGDPETVAILQLPEDLIVYAPFYRLDVKGQAPSHAEVTLPVPYELGVVARADLYGWNGSEWSWLPSDETPDGMYIRAQLEPLPKLLVVAQPYASSVLIGVDVSPVSYQAPAAADLVYVPGLYLAGGPELVGEVPNALDVRVSDGARRLLSLSNVIDGIVRSDLLDNMVIDEQTRQAHVASILAYVQSGGYDGVEVAYMGLDPELRAEFLAFVQELREALDERDGMLAVRVEAPALRGDTWETGSYDWTALGQRVDLIRLPALVDPAAYSPGHDMDNLLDWATDHVNRLKLDLVVSGYSHDTAEGQVSAVSYDEALGRISQGMLTDHPEGLLMPGEVLKVALPSAGPSSINLHEDAQVYWFEYRDSEGRAHTVWLESGSSVARKLQYVSQYGLGAASIEHGDAPGNALDVQGIVQAFRDVRMEEPINAGAQFAFVCTVEDAEGHEVGRGVLPLSNASWTWTAPNNPGSYVIRAALSDDGGQTNLKALAEVEVEVPTPTFTPSPTPTETPLPTPTAAPKPTAAPQAQPQVAAARSSAPGYFGYGIQPDMVTDTDHGRILSHINAIGFNWVKQQVEWFRYNPAPGQYDWGPLDRIVESANAHGVNVLFSVVKAPRWARPPGDTDEGPPADLNTYATFMREMAARYKGRVKAYEIWNEQNLYYEWGGRGGKLNAGRYVEMLKLAYNAIKSVDPGAVVVSGALTPTGVNDGDIAIDDRVYLEQMYQAGLARYCDAVGAHPSGYNNPPDADWRTYNDPSAPDFKGHPSFFFRGTMESYRNIMVKYGDGHKRIWPTEFGWASVEGLGVGPAPGYGYAANNTEAEQAQFILRAYQMGKAWGWVGPMFLWNLNFAPVAGRQDEKAAFGIVRHDWSPRPAFAALRDMAK